MKQVVVHDGCIGCGACQGNDPEHFEITDEGLSQVISQENLESEALKSAIDSCPVGVISLEEKEESAE